MSSLSSMVSNHRPLPPEPGSMGRHVLAQKVIRIRSKRYHNHRAQGKDERWKEKQT